MAGTKVELKARNRKLKKRVKNLRKIVKIGLRTIRDKDARIAQLTSVLTHEQQAVPSPRLVQPH